MQSNIETTGLLSIDEKGELVFNNPQTYKLTSIKQAALDIDETERTIKAITGLNG